MSYRYVTACELWVNFAVIVALVAAQWAAMYKKIHSVIKDSAADDNEWAFVGRRHSTDPVSPRQRVPMKPRYHELFSKAFMIRLASISLLTVCYLFPCLCRLLNNVRDDWNNYHYQTALQRLNKAYDLFSDDARLQQWEDVSEMINSQEFIFQYILICLCVCGSVAISVRRSGRVLAKRVEDDRKWKRMLDNFHLLRKDSTFLFLVSSSLILVALWFWMQSKVNFAVTENPYKVLDIRPPIQDVGEVRRAFRRSYMALEQKYRGRWD